MSPRPPIAIAARDPDNGRRRVVHAWDEDADESLCEYIGPDQVVTVYRNGVRPVPFAKLDRDVIGHRICASCQRIHRIRWMQ